jgi:hypothetical protein
LLQAESPSPGTTQPSLASAKACIKLVLGSIKRLLLPFQIVKMRQVPFAVKEFVNDVYLLSVSALTFLNAILPGFAESIVNED